MSTLLTRFTEQLGTHNVTFIDDKFNTCISQYEELNKLRSILIEVTEQVILSEIKSSVELQIWFEKDKFEILNKLANETELDFSYVSKESTFITLLLLELTLGNDFKLNEDATEHLETWIDQQEDIEYGLLEQAQDNNFVNMYDEIMFIRKILL